MKIPATQINWEPGNRYLAQVGMGDHLRAIFQAVLWEVEPTDSHHLVVLSLAPAHDIHDEHGSWIPVRGYMDHNGRIDADYGHLETPRLPTRCEIPFSYIWLYQYLGAYLPNDSASNGIDVMRESVKDHLRLIHNVQAWDLSPQTASLRPLLAQVDERRGQLREAEAERDEAIRELLTRKAARPSEIVAETGLSRARIDQIRRGERV